MLLESARLDGGYPCAGTTSADQLGRGSSAATVGWIPAPKVIHVLAICTYCQTWQKDFADVVMLRNLSWGDYLDDPSNSEVLVVQS